MALLTFKLPDIGEGIAEAEIAGWLVKVGDLVREDEVICEVTTDKATVEIPAAASGRIAWINGKPGDIVAIGSDLVRIETDTGADLPEDAAPAADPAAPVAEAPTARLAEPAPAPEPARPAPTAGTRRAVPSGPPVIARGPTGRPLAAPARTRLRMIEARVVEGVVQILI